MISCPKCGKDNQDHYKFCLGCGAELPREKEPKPFHPQTPPHGIPAQAPPAQAAPAPAAAPPPQPIPAVAAPPRASSAAPAAATPVTCPQCSHVNTTSNKFCASCGYNLGAIGVASRPAQPAVAPQAHGPIGAVTLTALRADGSEAGRYPLPTDQPTITLGRDTGSIFAGDSYLSPRHATFSLGAGSIRIRDEGSLNGIYLKLKPNDPWPLDYEDVFRIGQEIIRFERLSHPPPSPDGVERLGSPAKGYIGRIALVVGRDTTGNAFPVPESGIHCGRERGDVLFSEDGYVSGLHCKIHQENGQVFLTDVGSSNGTFARLKTERQLLNGDVLLMGQQLFRVDT